MASKPPPANEDLERALFKVRRILQTKPDGAASLASANDTAIKHLPAIHKGANGPSNAGRSKKKARGIAAFLVELRKKIGDVSAKKAWDAIEERKEARVSVTHNRKSEAYQVFKEDDRLTQQLVRTSLTSLDDITKPLNESEPAPKHRSIKKRQFADYWKTSRK